MKIPVIVHIDHFDINPVSRARLRQAVKDNGRPLRAYLETISPESRAQRKYVMGGLIPLLVYLDGHDYHDSETTERYFDFLKRELQPEIITINGKSQIFGKSTKGSKALNEFIEKIQDFLLDQYGVEYSNKAISSDEYKKFRDEVYPTELQYSDWISYCIAMKWIK